MILGRKTLVRSVLLAIPNYFMYTIRVHVSVCNEIERLASNFIWGSIENSRKTLLSWDDCCHPLNSDGLGLRKLNVQNKTFLIKLVYRLLSSIESLWVRVLRNKYNVQRALLNSISQSNCSFVWKSLMQVWPNIVRNVFLSVSDDRMTNFWNDV